MDGEVLAPNLVRLYPRERKKGRPSYNPVVTLTILLLSYLS